MPETESPSGVYEGLRNAQFAPDGGPPVRLAGARLVQRRRRPGGGSVVAVEATDLHGTRDLPAGAEGSLSCEAGAVGYDDPERAWTTLEFGRVRFLGARPLVAGRGLIAAVEVRFLALDPE